MRTKTSKEKAEKEDKNMGGCCGGVCGSGSSGKSKGMEKCGCCGADSGKCCC